MFFNPVLHRNCTLVRIHAVSFKRVWKKIGQHSPLLNDRVVQEKIEYTKWHLAILWKHNLALGHFVETQNATGSILGFLCFQPFCSCNFVFPQNGTMSVCVSTTVVWCLSIRYCLFLFLYLLQDCLGLQLVPLGAFHFFQPSCATGEGPFQTWSSSRQGWRNAPCWTLGKPTSWPRLKIGNTCVDHSCCFMHSPTWSRMSLVLGLFHVLQHAWLGSRVELRGHARRLPHCSF